MTINEYLSWKDHMNILKTKLRSVLEAVLRVKPYLNKNTILTLYHSLWMNNIKYCVTNWCIGNKTIINQLQCICNKFIMHTKQLPSALSDISLMKKCSIGSRNNSSIITMACRISLSQQSIQYVGPKIWNEVPPSINNNNN